MKKGIKLSVKVSKGVVEQKYTQDVKEEWKKRFVAKQQLKVYYGLSEKEYKRLRKGVSTAQELVEKLEKRLDVIVLRLGWANSLEDAKEVIKLNKLGNRKSYLEVGRVLKRSIRGFGDLKIKEKHETIGSLKGVWLKELNINEGVLWQEPKFEKVSLPFTLDINKL